MPKNIQNNLYYFKISQENLESHLDANYFFLNKHPELSNYVSEVKNIKEILITIKRLKREKEDEKLLINILKNFL